MNCKQNMCMEFFIDQNIQKVELGIAEAKQNNRSKQFIEKLEEELRWLRTRLVKK